MNAGIYNGNIQDRLEKNDIDYVETFNEVEEAINSDKEYVTVSDLRGEDSLVIDDEAFFTDGSIERASVYTIEGVSNRKINEKVFLSIDVVYDNGEEESYIARDRGLIGDSNDTQRIVSLEELEDTHLEP